MSTPSVLSGFKAGPGKLLSPGRAPGQFGSRYGNRCGSTKPTHRKKGFSGVLRNSRRSSIAASVAGLADTGWTKPWRRYAAILSQWWRVVIQDHAFRIPFLSLTAPI